MASLIVFLFQKTPFPQCLPVLSTYQSSLHEALSLGLSQAQSTFTSLRAVWVFPPSFDAQILQAWSYTCAQKLIKVSASARPWCGFWKCTDPHPPKKRQKHLIFQIRGMAQRSWPDKRKPKDSHRGTLSQLYTAGLWLIECPFPIRPPPQKYNKEHRRMQAHFK